MQLTFILWVLLAAHLVCIVVSNHVSGSIIGYSGAIQIFDESLVPNNISEGNWENSDFLQVFLESQNFLLSSSVAVDISSPGTYGRTAGFVPVNDFINAGSYVNSHYVHFDPIGIPPNLTRVGSISFDTDIVGIIVGVLNGTNVGAPNNTLGLSNPILGVPRITYDEAIADLYLGGGDQLVVSNDRRTVSFTFISGRGSDNVRIITSATVPEPDGTSAYLLIATVLGAVLYRKHRAHHNASGFARAL